MPIEYYGTNFLRHKEQTHKSGCDCSCNISVVLRVSVACKRGISAFSHHKSSTYCRKEQRNVFVVF